MRRIERIYDELYDEAVRLFQQYNPYHFEEGKCSNVRLRDRTCCPKYCQYLGSKGCKTRNLSCKLHLCNRIGDLSGVQNNKQGQYYWIMVKIEELRQRAWKYGFSLERFYCSRKKHLRRNSLAKERINEQLL